MAEDVDYPDDPYHGKKHAAADNDLEQIAIL